MNEWLFLNKNKSLLIWNFSNEFIKEISNNLKILLYIETLIKDSYEYNDLKSIFDILKKHEFFFKDFLDNYNKIDYNEINIINFNSDLKQKLIELKKSNIKMLDSIWSEFIKNNILYF